MATTMADMTQEELAELLNYVEDNGLEKTMEKYNMTIDELIDIYPVGEEILQARPDLMDEAIKLLGGDQQEGSMEVLDEGSFNPEDENEAITSEFMPGDTMVGDAISWLANKAGIPEEAALALAGITSKNPAKVRKAADGMFTPKMTKKGTADKRGAKSAEVKESGTTRSKGKEEQFLKKEYGPAAGRKVDKDKQLVVSPQGDLVPVGKKKGMLANLSKKDKQAIGTTAGLSALTTAIGLSGDRGDDGSLKTAPITDKQVVKEPEPKEQETVNDCSQFGPGFHKLPGQNFCTRNDEDPYWKTDAGRIELGEMEPPRQEFDIDKFMSLFR